MLVLAVILILVAAVVALGALLGGAGAAAVHAFGVTLNTTKFGVFLLGAGTMLALLLGLLLLQGSMRRARRKRAEVKALKNQRNESVHKLEEERARLAAEKARLEEQLQQERAEEESVRSRTATGPTARTEAGTVVEERVAGSSGGSTRSDRFDSGSADDRRGDRRPGDGMDKPKGE